MKRKKANTKNPFLLLLEKGRHSRGRECLIITINYVEEVMEGGFSRKKRKKWNHEERELRESLFNGTSHVGGVGERPPRFMVVIKGTPNVIEGVQKSPSKG